MLTLKNFKAVDSSKPYYYTCRAEFNGSDFVGLGDINKICFDTSFKTLSDTIAYFNDKNNASKVIITESSNGLLFSVKFSTELGRGEILLHRKKVDECKIAEKIVKLVEEDKRIDNALSELSVSVAKLVADTEALKIDASKLEEHVKASGMDEVD